MSRLRFIDLARTGALAGMILFHGARDLEMLGLVTPGMTRYGGWALLARLVAGTFLALAGASLVLAHGQGVRWRAFARRLAQIVLAAGAVSVATWFIAPGYFIYFGVLHCIAAASVIGLVFLRLHWAVVAVTAAMIWALDQSGVLLFDTPALGWTGLAPRWRPSWDLLPLVPWLVPFLAGMAAMKAAAPRLRGSGLRHDWVEAASRHSLLIYLVHQPVLMAVLWTVSRVIHWGSA